MFNDDWKCSECRVNPVDPSESYALFDENNELDGFICGECLFDYLFYPVYGSVPAGAGLN